MRHHLAVREFPEPVMAATKELFKQGPWRGNPVERRIKFQVWLDKACAHHGMEPLNLLVAHHPDLVPDDIPPNTIILRALTILELFHGFYHHFLDHVNPLTEADVCLEAHGWACSLFYQGRPETFCKSVSKGLIPDMTDLDMVEMDSAGMVLAPGDRDIFDQIADQLADDFDEDQEMLDLIAEFNGEGN